MREEPRRKRRKRMPHPARQVEEPDPLADKKALRDALLTEVAQLEDDLRIAARENERLHRAQGGSRRRTADLDLPDAEEQSRLLEVLRRHALPPEKEAAPDPSRDWLEAAMNPIAFLPFGHGALAPPLILPGAAKEEKEEEKEPPVSHHPIPMTADEELPYLQVFTPLTFTSTITTLQQDTAETDPAPLLQRHAISVASSPPGLFAATVDMAVDTKTLAVIELAVPRLDPAAVPELGPFIDSMLRGGGNSALTRNISVVTWAMGEWVRLATRRARFWHAVTRELGSADKVLRCAEVMRRRTKRGRSQQQQSVDDDDEDEVEKKEPSRADVIALMGRSSLDLVIPPGDNDDELVTARICWKVEFDWTGEARCLIRLLLGAPAKCELFLYTHASIHPSIHPCILHSISTVYGPFSFVFWARLFAMGIMLTNIVSRACARREEIPRWSPGYVREAARREKRSSRGGEDRRCACRGRWTGLSLESGGLVSLLGECAVWIGYGLMVCGLWFVLPKMVGGMNYE